MANLLLEMIAPDLPAFTDVGVDYCGPLEVKKYHGKLRLYGVFFTCVTSRAVHLEVAYALFIHKFH